MALALTIRSMTHFELILCLMWGKGYPVIAAPFMENNYFFPYNPGTFVKNQLTLKIGSISELSMFDLNTFILMSWLL